MTYLAALLIFLAFFALVGVGVLIAKKTFRGCACSADPNALSCCKDEQNKTDCEKTAKK